MSRPNLISLGALSVGVKVDGRFRFQSDDDDPDKMSETFEGQLDLIEHAYNSHFHFWYGVAHVHCSHKQFLDALNKAGSARLCVGVELSDGRCGFARMTGFQIDLDSQAAKMFVGLVGDTELRGAP
jgi:hypothetical protein